jgi:hypothetical protein
MVANQQQQLPSLTHQQAQPAPVQQPAQQQQDELFKPFSLKDPDTWGPDTKELVDQLNAHFKDTFDRAGQQIGQLKQNLTVSMEREQAQQVQHYVRTFDNTVNGLGEGWDKVFGQGDASTLNRSSAEFRNRVRLDQAVAEVCAARQVAGLPQIPTEVAIQRALQVEYAKESADIAREQLARKATGRQSQFINRPSARRGAGITPTEKATDFVSGFFKDRGIASAVDDDIPTDL